MRSIEITTSSYTLASYQEWDVSSPLLVLFLPGKLDAGNYQHMIDHIEYVWSMWHLWVSFDPPGTRNSGDDMQLYNTSNYLKSVDELIEYFGNRRTILVGHSRGWTISIINWVQNEYVVWFVDIMWWYTLNPKIKPIHPDKLVERKKTWYYSVFRDLPPWGWEKVKEYKLPYSFYEDQILYQPENELSKCIKPKMFILGKKDTTVDPRFIKEWYELAWANKKIVELNSGHDYRLDKNSIKAVSVHIWEFIKSLT